MKFVLEVCVSVNLTLCQVFNSTKQYISAQFCDEQMSEIWCKNIRAFLRYSNFRVGIFYFDSPCIMLNYCTHRKCQRLHHLKVFNTIQHVRKARGMQVIFIAPCGLWPMYAMPGCLQARQLGLGCPVTRDQPNSREKMRDFTIEFLKCAKFHGKFTEGVWKIHGKFTGPTAVISRCYVHAN